jgi:hypothetical protein
MLLVLSSRDSLQGPQQTHGMQQVFEGARNSRAKQ